MRTDTKAFEKLTGNMQDMITKFTDDIDQEWITLLEQAIIKIQNETSGEEGVEAAQVIQDVLDFHSSLNKARRS